MGTKPPRSPRVRYQTWHERSFASSNCSHEKVARIEYQKIEWEIGPIRKNHMPKEPQLIW